MWIGLGLLAALVLTGCLQTPAGPTTTNSPPPPPSATLVPSQTSVPSDTPAPTATDPMQTQLATQTTPPSPTFTATPKPLVPHFSHVIVIILENKEFGSVIGNGQMPNFNRLASQYTLLTQHFAIQHPSLPNYLALIGGDTFKVHSDCEDCYQHALSLPDQIEASGRTWKTYQEDMPSACFAGSRLDYAQKHNPFMYFDDIRLNAERCTHSVVPLTQLDTDLAAGKLPDFVFITPNMCNNAHDCPLNIADIWLSKQVAYLMAYPAFQQGGLIILTWDEGQGDHGCCGFDPGGGRVATVLISALVKNGFEDDTPYSHYSFLKTIEAAWGLEYLGHAADELTSLIIKPWK